MTPPPPFSWLLIESKEVEKPEKPNEDPEEEENPEEKEDVKDQNVDEELLEKLFAIFDQRYIDLTSVLPPLPKKGDFDVTSIKRSQYFFS